jgi:hypothetical protein
MCPRCGVYTWSGGLISQWIDHMTCEVSWAYSCCGRKKVGCDITQINSLIRQTRMYSHSSHGDCK